MFACVTSSQKISWLSLCTGTHSKAASNTGVPKGHRFLQRNYDDLVFTFQNTIQLIVKRQPINQSQHIANIGTGMQSLKAALVPHIFRSNCKGDNGLLLLLLLGPTHGKTTTFCNPILITYNIYLWYINKLKLCFSMSLAFFADRNCFKSEEKK